MAEGKDVAGKKNTSTVIRVSPEDFVRIWQGANNFDAVIEATGLSKTAANGRANVYRKKGIPLRKFIQIGSVGRSPLDIEALAELARSLAPKE